MLGNADLVAFVPTSDLAASRRFYEDILGLQLVADESPIACVFDANGTTLRVTAVGEFEPARSTVVGWNVADIASAIDTLAARGVTFSRFGGFDQDDRGIWTTPGGDRVAWFHDPAGNTLSLTQLHAAG